MSDSALRRFLLALEWLLLLIFLTAYVQAQPAKNLEVGSKLTAVSCTFHLSAAQASVWRQSGEGQLHYLGPAGEPLSLGLNDPESEGKRDIILEFSVPLWSGEWRSEKVFLSALELAQTGRFPESGQYELRMTSLEKFQAVTKAHPLVTVLLGITSLLAIVFAARRKRIPEAKSEETRCGDYVLLELLGKGGMGEVYAARDTDGEPCAIKLIKGSKAREERFRELFDQEISTCLKLKHPNLVPIYAYGVTEDGQVYLVGKKLEGMTLKEKLASRDYDPPRLAAEVLEQIGSALGYLHSSEHMHCDVKPSNIFIDGDNKFWLMDLGVARSLAQSSSDKVWGSPAYLAPEQNDGQPVYESDQYSLGVVLYEILTGRRPFLESDKTSLNFHHKNTKPPQPSELESRLNDEIEAALLQMLEKDPKIRHQDFDEVRIALCDSLFHLKW